MTKFDKIKDKLTPDVEVKKAIGDTIAGAVVGAKIGLTAGLLLLPLTVTVVLVEKAAR